MASFRVGRSHVRGAANNRIRGADTAAVVGTVAPGTGMMMATKAPDAVMGFTKAPDAVTATVQSLPSVTVTGTMKDGVVPTVVIGDSSPKTHPSVTASPNRR